MTRIRLAAALLVVLAGCSSSHPAPTEAGSSAPPSSSASAPSAPGGGSTGTGATPAPTGGSGASGGPATSRAPGSTGSSAPAPSSSPTLTASPAPDGTAAYGTYPVAIDGAESFGTSPATQSTRTYPTSSTVDLKPAGGSRKLFHVRWSSQRSDDVTVSLAGRAVHLVTSLTHVQIGFYSTDQRFTPTPAVLLFPAGAKVGQHWSGDANDGSVHAHYTGSVLRSETLTVGGTRVRTLVVKVHIQFSGDYSGTTDSVVNWDPTRLAPVRQRSDSVIDAQGAHYEQHATLTLRRLTPN